MTNGASINDPQRGTRSTVSVPQALEIALQHHRSGRLGKAEAIYRKVLAANPRNPDALHLLGLIAHQTGRPDVAVSLIRQAIDINASVPFYHNNIGECYRALNRFQEAMDHFRRALVLKETFPEAHANLGAVLREQGEKAEALRHYERAIALRPDFVSALWGRLIAQIPVLYETPEEIRDSRNHFIKELDDLTASIRLDSRSGIESAANALGTLQPYYLPYQGENDKELMSRYGDLVCRIQAARYPEWAVKLPMPEIKAGEPIRVGIATGFFCDHSVWKIPTRGWVEELDKDRFALYGYHTGRRRDGETEIARRLCTRFVENASSFENLSRIIRQDNLHVLIYPEIGMDPTALKLASLRLAPIQCNSIGNPITCGLPTIDYYLTSDLMEPPDGDLHYREKLVRLPNIGIQYNPVKVEPAPMDRAELGLRTGAVIYLCAQFLPKYLPQYDEVFPRIAKQVDDCQFIFLGFPKSKNVTTRFVDRLGTAFSRYGLNGSTHIVALPYLDKVRYQAVNELADVFLDSIGWNGCHTTLESFSSNLPVVTFPGRFMRDRHTCGILTMIGMKETIASSVDEYVALAIHLGRDEAFRRSMSARIADNKHKVYGDMTSVRALERFLEEAVRNPGNR